MHKHLLKIIVPVYRSAFTSYEDISINRCREILIDYPLVFVKPESLNPDELLKKYPEFQQESFSSHFFQGKEGYNQLMLSSGFYERFLDTKYILIYQPDAYIFKDDLKHWCNMNFDYIGAPWIQKERDLIALFFHKRKLKQKPYKEAILFKVGNGGFSLRKVFPFYEITRKEKSLIASYISPVDKKSDFIPEDVFWALEPHKLGYEFNIPDYRQALEFAFDQYPVECLEINGKLPLGCHAWCRRKEIKFWKKHIMIK